MTKKFLKEAGCKTTAEFYKKYPDEKSFFKAHPGMRKYAKGGTIPKYDGGGTSPYALQPGFIGPLTEEDYLQSVNNPNVKRRAMSYGHDDNDYSGFTVQPYANTIVSQGTPEGMTSMGNIQADPAESAFADPVKNPKFKKKQKQGGGSSMTLGTAPLIAGLDALATQFIYNPQVREREAQMLRNNLQPVTTANNFYGNNDMGMYMAGGGYVPQYKTRRQGKMTVTDIADTFLPKEHMMPLTSPQTAPIMASPVPVPQIQPNILEETLHDKMGRTLKSWRFPKDYSRAQIKEFLPQLRQPGSVQSYDEWAEYNPMMGKGGRVPKNLVQPVSRRPASPSYDFPAMMNPNDTDSSMYNIHFNSMLTNEPHAVRNMAEYNKYGLPMVGPDGGNANIDIYNQDRMRINAYQDALSKRPNGYQNAVNDILSTYAKGGQVDEKFKVDPTSANVNVERGEMMQLPDGSAFPVSGDKHSDPSGGEYMSVPGGTRVFSDQIKADKDFIQEVTGNKTKKKMSISKLAKKYDTTKEDEVLSRPSSDPIATRTANIMKAAKEAKLSEIFDYQEFTKDPDMYTDKQIMAKGGIVSRLIDKYGNQDGNQEEDEKKKKGSNILGQLSEMGPEFVGLINTLTDFPVWNQQFQPKYLPQAPQLNVQPQLNRNYSQARTVLDSNSGNPSVDNARGAQVFANLLDANDNIMGQKYNADSQAKFRVDSQNVSIENQAALTNLERTDKFWDKVTQRQANKEKGLENIAQSTYQKAKARKMEERSTELLNQMFSNYQYDPSTGLMFNPNGNIVHIPSMYNGMGNLYNSTDGIKTRVSEYTDSKGNKKKRYTMVEDDDN